MTYWVLSVSTPEAHAIGVKEIRHGWPIEVDGRKTSMTSYSDLIVKLNQISTEDKLWRSWPVAKNHVRQGRGGYLERERRMENVWCDFGCLLGKKSNQRIRTTTLTD